MTPPTMAPVLLLEEGGRGRGEFVALARDMETVVVTPDPVIVVL